MAVMIPESAPSDERGARAERDLYLGLQDQLSDDFFVFHGLEILSDSAQEREIDFLVAHAELGLLCLECKGGGVELNSRGQWIRRHGGRQQRMNEGPWEQSSAQMHLLARVIGQRCEDSRGYFRRLADRYRGCPVAYGHAVAFPFADRETSRLPMETDEKILLDAGDMDDLAARVREAMEFWRGNHRKADLSAQEFEDFRKIILYPELSLASTLAQRIESEDRAFERLTREQVNAIRAILSHDRIGIEGGAGTGKTLLATEAARQWANQGQRVLLTCFNKKLASHLDRVLERAPNQGPGEIEVSHFHSLCTEAADRLDRDIEFPDPDAPEADTFWEEEFPFVLMEALESGVMEGWDAIVVDEGQDFADFWWDTLQAGLEDGESGRMALFYDPSQNIFAKDRNLPDLEVHYPLTWNFRNTTEIAQVVEAFYDGRAAAQSHPRTPHGESPEVEEAPGAEDQRDSVDQLVRRLVTEERIGPEQMALLTPRTQQNSSFRELETLGGVPMTNDVEESDSKLLHSSISGFKGLERDIIILADVEPDHERCNRKARYVAASRAENRLFVFEKSDWMSDVPTD